MNQKIVSLSLNTIIRECSINPNLEQEHYYYFMLTNRENIHKVFKYRKFNDDFTSVLACFDNGENIIGNIRPSYEEFLDKLLTILNIEHDNPKDDNELTKKMLERLKVLKQITTEKDLSEEFPILYRDLIEGRKYLENLTRLRQQENVSEKEFVSGEHYYYGCALKKSLSNFIKSQSLMYGRYIKDRHKLKEEFENASYNRYIARNMDMPRFYMYVIHEYLKAAELSKDLAERRKLASLVEKYINSPIDKSCMVTTDDGTQISFINIRTRFLNLKDELESNNSIVNWIIIPEGKSLSQVSTTKKAQPRTVKKSQKEVEKLRQAGEQKTVFYESTPYIAKAIGLKRYRGYIAYIYKNGEVILDREYNESTPRGIKDNAIYHLHIGDFESLSKLDKQVLIKDSRVGRFFHTKNWQKKVLKIINRQAGVLEEEGTLQLVKKLKEKTYQ